MIFSPNSIAWPIILFGAVAAGLRCTLANSAYNSTELQYQWTNSRAKVVFVHPSLVGVVMEMFGNGLGWDEEETRKRVVVSGTEWLTGEKDKGILLPRLSSIQLNSCLPSSLKLPCCHPSPTPFPPQPRDLSAGSPIKY